MSHLLNHITYEQRARVGRLINRGESELIQALDKALESFGVTAAQYVILSALRAGRGDTAAQICKEISYTPGAMTRMIDRLEKKQLLRRLRYADDRRSVKLELTPGGQEIFPELLAAATTVIDRFFGHFDANELCLLETLMQKMLRRV
ncbi:TPA: MarR family transcriptional regulator [Pseudomonas putida]|uniref:MarR family winged helix-turn-helix transcriptional regulator n=1 Tax=Pseudomonas putida TaxID=303 RepID=UPI00236454EB|nr:MarR family transcriptional regulator [Pseudomonas putida]MDD2008338.1 MarR family transcriptional regulator [Pseudomonas putida]HDS1775804.1 MarR family transcriptional regulator [Pseudomonas putida]